MSNAEARDRLDELEARENVLVALAATKPDAMADASGLADHLLRQLDKPDYWFLDRHGMLDVEPSPEAGAEAVKTALATVSDADRLLLSRIRAREYVTLSPRDGLAALLVELITERLLEIRAAGSR